MNNIAGGSEINFRIVFIVQGTSRALFGHVEFQRADRLLRTYTAGNDDGETDHSLEKDDAVQLYRTGRTSDTGPSKEGSSVELGTPSYSGGKKQLKLSILCETVWSYCMKLCVKLLY